MLRPHRSTRPTGSHRRPGTPPTGRWRRRTALLAAVPLLASCSLFRPSPVPDVGDASSASSGPVGYVVCPSAVTPIELSTGTAEADIDLPITGSPSLGDYAIATSPDGTRAYVVTSDGVAASGSPATSAIPATTGATPGAASQPGLPGSENVVIPIDLLSQRAGRPIVIPGDGGTHGIVVGPGGTIVYAVSGSTVVPVDVDTRRVGTPVNVGATHPIFGLVENPSATMLYALVAGGVFPISLATGAVGAPIVTGLSVSSVYSPHGIAISADGSTLYTVGEVSTGSGGRIAAASTSTGVVGPVGSFDAFGVGTPSAVTLLPNGTAAFVTDLGNNWVDPVPISRTLAPNPPVRLPASGDGMAIEHPSDIVLEGSGPQSYVVAGFDSVLPFNVATQQYGNAIPVCQGASSMAVTVTP